MDFFLKIGVSRENSLMTALSVQAKRNTNSLEKMLDLDKEIKTLERKTSSKPASSCQPPHGCGGSRSDLATGGGNGAGFFLGYLFFHMKKKR